MATKFVLGKYRLRRLVAVILALAGVATAVALNPSSYEQVFEPLGAQMETAASGASGDNAAGGGASDAGDGDAGAGDAEDGSATGASAGAGDASGSSNTTLATEILAKLEIKGRAPKTGYAREEFYTTWPSIDGCSLRQRIIRRELGETATLDTDKCTVLAGSFTEPYTGQYLTFTQKTEISKGLQIDHVVALSDAWQKGAQYLDADVRYQMATDPLNLIAVDSSANQKKSDGDAATWLPANKAFRCQYVARQVSVKYKYGLWVTQAEYDAIAKVLETCPQEPAVGV